MARGILAELVSDIAIGSVVGAGAGALADRWAGGTKRQLAYGAVGAGSGAIGLGLKLWSAFSRGGHHPNWKDDVGDPMVVSGSLLGGLMGMRAIDTKLGVTTTTSTTDLADAGMLAEAQYALAVQAGDLPAGLTEINGGVPLTQAELATAMADNPHLAYNATEGMWDDSSSTDDWTSGAS